MCCGAKFKVTVERGNWAFIEIETKCGNTSPTGDPYLCDKCAERLKNVNWRARAAEFGERYEEDE